MHDQRTHHGPIFSITTVIYGRYALFTDAAYLIPLYDSLHFYLRRDHTRLLGYVFMPDHIHLLLWPHDPDDLGALLRDFKSFTAKRILRQAEVEDNQPLLAHLAAAGCLTSRCEHKLWQAGSWLQDVFTDRFVRQKLNYFHRNPVRAGLVAHPEEYPYSSFRSYVCGEDWLIAVDRSWT